MPNLRKQITDILNDCLLKRHFQPVVEKILGCSAFIYRISDCKPMRQAEFNQGAMFRLLNGYFAEHCPVVIEPTGHKFDDNHKIMRASAKSNPLQLAFTADIGQAVRHSGRKP